MHYWIFVKTPQNVNTRVQQYLGAHFGKISMEDMDAYLMGDFNINLINYDSHNPTSQFLDGICSNSFYPSYIDIPTRPTPRSKTLIDIIHNNINENAISGRLTTDISDHLAAPFLITLNLAKTKMKPKKIITGNLKILDMKTLK